MKIGKGINWLLIFSSLISVVFDKFSTSLIIRSEMQK